MNSKRVGIKPLYVALAQLKEERRVRLQVSGLNDWIFFFAYHCGCLCLVSAPP